LFSTREPQARRCFAVLNGVPPAGKIIVDDLLHPQWAVIQEVYDNDLFLGGKIEAAAFRSLFADLRKDGDVLVGMGLDDPRISLLPAGLSYDGRMLEFYDRPMGEGLEKYLSQVPVDCNLKRIDRELILRTEWGPGDVEMSGGLDGWEKTHFGYCLMRGDEILSEATVGLPALGLYEPGVFTQESYRGMGYGTITTARLIQEIESMGAQTYWNCDKDNLPSIAIARKLGYRVEKEFRCMGWRKTG
jgi:GNAT superfamily N-acetyltransferase